LLDIVHLRYQNPVTRECIKNRLSKPYSKKTYRRSKNPKNIQEWNNKHVINWLATIDKSYLSDIFVSNQIKGSDLTQFDFKELGLPRREIKSLMKHINKLL
jgi:hypothetical protein